MYHPHDISGPSLKGNSNEFNSHKFCTFMFLFNGWPISISLPRKKLLKENIFYHLHSFTRGIMTMVARNSLFSRNDNTFLKNYTMGRFLDPFREIRPKILSLASFFFRFWLQEQISIVSHNFYTIMIRNLHTFLHHAVVLLSLYNLRPLSCWYNHLGKNCGSAEKKCHYISLATKNAQFWKITFSNLFLLCIWW